ncbi:hypothetical protein BDV26DRAFT_228048 [Aspergillus bertholletiae]|uniref:Zn(2)-C6 fungal-type domain-containing protein n=1 Tax=Aspergillus bertholletiae TaxID=1226010 RepID=A0A5N7B404_9EURO|nr:hypothetical protein BDV26DRAFT_228048 [Aspergillus bertholletiae]
MTAISLVRSNKQGKPSRKRSLWLPIIAPKNTTSSSGVNLPTPVKASTPRSRRRFPPRSRTGCWTCRSRKVKCDEKHPRCNQCTRLGHDCDYRPRLSFRDDTRRVIARMSDVKTIGNLVWDPHVCRNIRPPADYGLPDLLPSFATLTSDEEWERKAQSSLPGTYTVVIMPASFSYLPGHADEKSGAQCRSSTSSPLLDIRQCSQQNEAYDPNVIILKIFPDVGRCLCSNCRGSTHMLEPDSLDFSCSSTASVYSADLGAPDELDDQDQAKLMEYESMLLSHFRNVVWPKLVGQGIWSDESDGHRLGVEVLEQEAAIYPPLFQVMMAISKLALDRQGHSVDMSTVNPCQHNFLLPQNIHHHRDSLPSDGLFLTEFLLLIHGVMAATPDGSIFWSHHISQMLEITFMRQSVFGVERFPFVIWWVCYIDLYALLSGTGTGDYVKMVIERDLLPWPEFISSSIGSSGSSITGLHELGNLTLLLRLYKDMFRLAVQLGLVITDLKKPDILYSYTPINLQQRGVDLCEDFKRLWDSSEVRFWAENQTSLPKQLHSILEQIKLLFHTSLLFYYTSTSPGQSNGLGEIPKQKVHHHSTTILQHAEAMIVKSPGSPQHSIIFPLFLAGVAAETIDLKVKAWELLSNLEENEIGYNASTTCHMLQLVYEYQMQRSGNGTRPFPWIDWIGFLAERGFRLVGYR